MKLLLFRGKVENSKIKSDSESTETVPVTLRIKEINLLKIKKNEKKADPGEGKERV